MRPVSPPASGAVWPAVRTSRIPDRWILIDVVAGIAIVETGASVEVHVVA